MDITVRKEGNDAFHIRIAGSIDTGNAEQLRTELDKIAANKPMKVVMDMSLVPTIDSSGMGKILIFYKKLDSMKSKFEIKGIQDNLYNVFKAVKLDKLFPISQK